jgi:hypothetical protein
LPSGLRWFRPCRRPSRAARRPAGVGLVVRLEFLARQFDQFGDECFVLGEPFFALDLGALAVAGVGEEVGPLRGQFFAGGFIRWR